MVTARDDQIDKIIGLELGADDYVTKPYSGRELVARVRNVLRRVASGLSRHSRRAHAAHASRASPSIPSGSPSPGTE